MEVDILREKKLRVTPFRREVLHIFLNSKHAIATQDIEKALGEHDRITLYRTLKSFIDKGVIHEITMPGEPVKMALCDVVCDSNDSFHEHNHVHFQCKDCNEVFCVDVDLLPKIELPGFIIEEQEIQARGFCSECSTEK